MEPDNDKLWKEFNIHIDLYKHHLALVLKFNIFYYAVTGGLLSFYFSKLAPNTINTLKWSLLFPVIMSVLYAVFFSYGAYLQSITRKAMKRIRGDLGLYTEPEMSVLLWILVISSILFVCIAFVLIGLMIYGPIF